MDDPLEIAQQQADDAVRKTNRLRSVFLERGVREYIREIANEYRRKVGGGSGAPEGDRENQDS